MSAMDESLLGAPSPSSVDGYDGAPAQVKRITAEWEPMYQRFLYSKADFEHQYAPLYFHRLKRLRPIVLDSVDLSDDKDVARMSALIDIKADVTCVVVGTIYKDMPLHPSILDEYAKERGMEGPVDRDSYVSDKDVIMLEDETGRAILVGPNVDAASFVTGVIVAVKGHETKSGEFHVDRIFYPGLPKQVPRPASDASSKYVALVSGMHVGDSSVNPMLQQLLVDYVNGNLGTPWEQQQQQAHIVRVILAGNSLCSSERQQTLSSVKSHSHALDADARSALLQPVQELDLLLSQLASNVDTDIMPGESDPANFLLPQQPFNSCMFPITSRLSTMHFVTNPYECSVDGVQFLGTAGQPVDNMRQYMHAPSAHQLVEDTLRWNLLAPTCPDTLPCYPFYDEDPFILEQCPHVYFVGGQEAFATSVATGEQGQQVRVISLPSFATTGTFVLLNLDTLECTPVTLDAF